MAAVNKIDGNETTASYSEETSLGVADGAAVWKQLEPNSYSDFGAQITTVARAPIVSDRQRKKGVTTDLEASGGISGDITQEALPDLAQGAFFADLRVKDEAAGTAITATSSYTVTTPGGTPYAAGDLAFAQGFDESANNGLKTVASSSATTLVVDETLVDDTAQAGTIRRVGFEFAAGDLDVTTTGDFVTLTTAVKDLTQLGLIPGEWIFLGGDTSGAAGNQFLTAANNGLKRVRSITANAMVLDKSEAAMATEVSTAETVQMFFAPRVLKNESDPTLIVRRSYQVERTLGAPDDAQLSQIQSQYLVGGVISTLQMNLATADKLTYDLMWMGTDEESYTGVEGVKAGTRPALLESDAYNSSSDIARINMSVVSTTSEAPSQLFTFIQEMNFTVDNSLSYNKAVGVLGAFDLTKGLFAVSGRLTAYFADVATIAAVRANSDVTLDFHMVKDNQGISVDFPLVTISDGRPNVENDSPVTLPISFEAASGAGVHTDLDHTTMLMFWDYLPTAAEA